jgi:hypothetical protein
MLVDLTECTRLCQQLRLPRSKTSLSPA